MELLHEKSLTASQDELSPCPAEPSAQTEIRWPVETWAFELSIYKDVETGT